MKYRIAGWGRGHSSYFILFVYPKAWGNPTKVAPLESLMSSAWWFRLMSYIGTKGPWVTRLDDTPLRSPSMIKNVDENRLVFDVTHYNVVAISVRMRSYKFRKYHVKAEK